MSASTTPNANTHSVSSRLYRSREQCVVLAIWIQYFIGAFILEDKVSHNFSAKASDRSAMLENMCSKHGKARNNKKLGVLPSFPKCFILSPSHPEPVTNTTWWWSKLSRHRSIRFLLRESFQIPVPRKASVRRKLRQIHSVHAACRAVGRLVQIRQGALLHDLLAHGNPRRLLVDVHRFAVVELRLSPDNRVGGGSSPKGLQSFSCASRCQIFLLAMHGAAKWSTQRMTDMWCVQAKQHQGVARKFQ